MSTLWQDLRYGVRMLARSPGFSAVVVLTLALGIGANAAVFTVINGILLHPVPYPEAERLVHIRISVAAFPGFQLGVAPPDFEDIRAGSDVFDSMAMYDHGLRNMTGNGEPEREEVIEASPDLFSLLGAAPIRGRLFSPADDFNGKGSVVLIGEGLWRQRFAADPNVIGKTLHLDSKPFTIIGVMPHGFAFLNDARLWVPLALTDAESSAYGTHSYFVLARLKRGVTIQHAQTEMDAIGPRIAQKHPDLDRGMKVLLSSVPEEAVKSLRRALLVLMGAAAFVLLIACANVGSLMLARCLGRQKEFAVRAALGASRGRIARQLLVESVVLAIVGGVAGLLLGVLGVDVFRALAPADMPRLAELRMDREVLAFTMGVCFLAAALFGLAPALRSSRAEIGRSLKSSGSASGAGSPGRQRMRNILVGLEVSLAFVLLIGSVLLIKSFERLTHVDPGFHTDHLLVASISLPEAKYPVAQERVFLEELLDRVKNMPIKSAAASSSSLLSDYLALMSGIKIEGAPEQTNASLPPLENKSVTPGYFDTVQIPIHKGRDFSRLDTANSQGVVIINEACAHLFWPGGDAIGKHISIGTDDKHQPKWSEVVGVVGDTRDVALNAEARPELYVPFEQDPSSGGIELFVRTESDPNALAATLRQQVWSLDPELPVSDLGSMEQSVERLVAPEKFRTVLLGAFAGLGVILALVGIYGVVSFAVSEQTRELGIRMALGAQRSEILVVCSRARDDLGWGGNCSRDCGSVWVDAGAGRFAV